MKMREVLLLFALPACLAACKREVKPSENEKIKAKALQSLTTFVNEKTAATDIYLDSIVVLDLDTLTPKDDSIWKLTLLQTSNLELFKLMKLQGEITTLVARQIRVFDDGSGGVPSALKNSFKEEKNKFEDIGAKIDLLDAQINKLTEVIESQSIDSLSHNGYLVMFKFVGHDPSNISLLDTQLARLSKDFHIIEHQ